MQSSSTGSIDERPEQIDAALRWGQANPRGGTLSRFSGGGIRSHEPAETEVGSSTATGPLRSGLRKLKEIITKGTRPTSPTSTEPQRFGQIDEGL